MRNKTTNTSCPSSIEHLILCEVEKLMLCMSFDQATSIYVGSFAKCKFGHNF